MVLVSPPPGKSVFYYQDTFSWNAVPGASQYHLSVGTIGVGSTNLFSQNLGSATSQLVQSLPINGSPVYARLWTLFAGIWQYNDYIYSAASSPKANLTYPPPGFTLIGPSQPFSWTPGDGGAQYHIYLGSKGVGSSDIFTINTGTATSQLVTNIPSTGQPLYARLWTLLAGVWQYNDYTFGLDKGAMVSPVQRSTLKGSTILFQWDYTADTQFHLYVGTTGVGSSNRFSLNVGNARTQSVLGLPTDGSTLYVRLWTLISGVWQFNDYIYTTGI